MKKINFSKQSRVTAMQLNGQDSVKETVARSGKMFLFLLFIFTVLPHLAHAQDVAGDINELFEDQIKPILRVLVAIGAVIASAVVGFQFFQGKQEALKKLVYVLAGAVVIASLQELVFAIIGDKL